jgi:hypothetical protein
LTLEELWDAVRDLSRDFEKGNITHKKAESKLKVYVYLYYSRLDKSERD